MKINKKVLLWMAELATVAGCIALLVSCTSPYPSQADVWVAGGGFLMRGVEAAQLTLTQLTSTMDTTSLAYDLLPASDSSAGLIASCEGELFSFGTPSKKVAGQLVFPAPGGNGLQFIDLTSVLKTSGALGAATSISTGGKKVYAVAQDALLSHSFDVTFPDDGSVAYYNDSAHVAFRTIQLAAGRRPTFVGSGHSHYVISGSDLVKLCNDCSGEAGSAPVDNGADDIAVGSGYVVVPSIASDFVYVFLDTGDDKPPVAPYEKITFHLGSPVRAAISHTSPTAYVTVYTGTEGMDPGFVYIIDLTTGRITNETDPIHVGRCPTPIAITQSLSSATDQNTGEHPFQDDSIVVGNQCENSLSRILLQDGTVKQTLSLPGMPNAIAVRVPKLSD